MKDLTLFKKPMVYVCEDGWHTWKLGCFSIESWSPDGVPKSYSWYVQFPHAEQDCRSAESFPTHVEARDNLEHVLGEFQTCMSDIR